MSMQWFVIILMGALLNLAPTAQAGGRVGSGGYGVMIDGKIHALDLATRGVHLDPYLSGSVSQRLPSELRDVLTYHLGRLVLPSVMDLVEKKFVELDARIKELKLNYRIDGMIVGMDRYRWLNLNNLQCLDVGDDDSPFPNKVQLAFRQGNWVRFCRDFNTLPEVDQAALVLHEIIYALHTEGQPFVTQLVGFLFSHEFKDFQALSKNELRTLINSLIGAPSSEPLTLFKRLDNLFEAGQKPLLSELQQPAIWVGRCTDQNYPDAVGSSAIFMYTQFDPVLGQLTTMIPYVAPNSDMRFLSMTVPDLEQIKEKLEPRVGSKAEFIRELDFSWRVWGFGREDFFRNISYPNEGEYLFQLRQAIDANGTRILVLKGDRKSNVLDIRCYYNARRQ